MEGEDVLQTSLWGAMRGLAVQALIHPLDVIKTHQRCREGNAMRIALEIFRKGGGEAFYNGFLPRLFQRVINQAWCWPMMTHLPSYFPPKWKEEEKQFATGLVMAGVDTVFTPLERAKMLAILQRQRFSLKNFYRQGWRGTGIQGVRLSVHWTTFLIAQKSLRDEAYQHSPELDPLQSIKIGLQVALLVSVTTSPFDVVHTLKQADIPLSTLFKRGLPPLYRGWPLHTLSLIINSIASIFVFDKLEFRRD